VTLHLAEIATQIAPKAHAVVLVDQAGWHLSGRLIAPSNITLIPFPAAPGAEPARKHLAILARQLAVKSDLQILRRHRRSLLRCMEQAHQPALAHHGDRPSGLRLSLMISEPWY
jgi:hypothetical protein